MTGILFDLDGTLLDTLEDLADAVNYALDHHGYPRRTLEEVRRFVGNGAARLIALAVPEGVPFEPVLATFQTYYRAHSQIKTRPYPGILEMLETVKARYPVAVVSNKPDPAVKLLCADIFGDIYALGVPPQRLFPILSVQHHMDMAIYHSVSPSFFPQYSKFSYLGQWKL